MIKRSIKSKEHVVAKYRKLSNLEPTKNGKLSKKASNAKIKEQCKIWYRLVRQCKIAQKWYSMTSTPKFTLFLDCNHSRILVTCLKYSQDVF